ncbi:MAG TPA: hypothetical protein VGL21_10150 [Jatrophihabitantaceae bacterium]|jgi:hypothetical protein
MNDVLVDVLRDRADLAPDPDELWDDIRHGIDARRGRRRATVAAAGASAAVATAAITAVAIVPARSHQHAITAGGPRPAPASTSRPTAPGGPPTRAVVGRPARLVPVKPPAAAKLVLSFAPEGWRYVGSSPSSTAYSNHGGSPDVFADKVVLLYGAPTQTRYPLTIGTHRGAIWTSTGYTAVEVRLSATRALTMQVPPALALTKTQLIKMVGTATVRAGALPGRG